MSRKASSIAKGIAILMMLMHHLFFSKDRILSHTDGQIVDFFPFDIGSVVVVSRSLKVCVAVFVIVTAYGTYRQIAKLLDEGEFNAPGARARLSARYALEHAIKLLISFQIVYLIAIAVGCFFPEHDIFAIYGGEGPLKAGFYMLADFFGVAALLNTPTFNSTWWYMSYALLLIFAMPAFVYLARKIGSLPVFMLSFMLPLMMGFSMTSTFWHYAPAVALGMMCAQYDIFEGMDRRLLGGSKPRHVIGLLICIALLVAVLFLRNKLQFYWVFETIGAFLVLRIAQHLEPFDVVFNFLGKYSMNMFFMHTFIYSYFFGSFIYSFGWFGLILIVLVAISLGCSVLVEYLKKWLRVPKLLQWINGKIRSTSAFAV